MVGSRTTEDYSLVSGRRLLAVGWRSSINGGGELHNDQEEGDYPLAIGRYFSTDGGKL